EDGRFVHAEDIQALARWKPGAPEKEIAFMPARVLLQDFTGVPAIVDLATMREAFVKMGGDAKRINPLFPAELDIDHSVQVDDFGNVNAFGLNAELEFRRNVERYAFLRWGQAAFQNFKVVPPDTGICHQVNLEYLARVVCAMPHGSRWEAYPDSVVGTDSHTTMVNSLGVFGWGVRSEEHTSELQSRFDLVCRLLLEKKKKKNDIIKISPLSVYSDIFAFLVSC